MILSQTNMVLEQNSILYPPFNQISWKQSPISFHMADTDPHSSEHSGESSISPSVLFELTTRMIEALSKALTSIPATDLAIAPIGIKLDGTNYALWSQVVEMYVADKDKLSYINGDLPQSSTIDPSFSRRWTENVITTQKVLFHSL